MPALPVQQPPAIPSELASQLGVFERGDHIYLTTPVQVFRPTADQIEEFAFKTAVRSTAPNENIIWFKGQYVEGDNANANGAMWRSEELAIKSLTPMLMPVTVMHDPRTAVGTIADVKLLTPEADGVTRSRIDTVLALWGHRFPDAVNEAEANAAAGTLMQSMECYSPWYECSECGAVFHKLPKGAEQSTWCEHLKASNPSAGYVDLGADAQRANASRILGDVCFTGTGLIFGTRGARGAYSEAHLETFEEELAQMHQVAHNATSTASNDRRPTDMGMVQIEDTELAILRKERDDARAEAAQEKTQREAAETAAEAAETAKTQAEAAKTAVDKELETEKEKGAQAELKDRRLGALGEGFTAKLGEFTKSRVDEQAKSLSDEDWENRLKELEEQAGVKRDAKKDGGGDPPPGDGDASPTFGTEELAGLVPGSGAAKPPSATERQSVVGGLAAAFKPTPAAK